MLTLLLVEDSDKLRTAMKTGLESTGEAHIIGDVASGEEALAFCPTQPPGAILMDVQLAGKMNGIEAAVAIRREPPRRPVGVYSIQDDDNYYSDFCRSAVLIHYAYA